MEFYQVSIIGKHNLWLESDEDDPKNWSLVELSDIEEIIGRKLLKKEIKSGREIVDSNDFCWKKVN